MVCFGYSYILYSRLSPLQISRIYLKGENFSNNNETGYFKSRKSVIKSKMLTKTRSYYIDYLIINNLYGVFMVDGQEKYVECSVCGTSILEQCAIEEHGQLLCGDCIVNETKKEVFVAEEAKKNKREEEYEAERKNIATLKKKKSLLILIVALLIFCLTQLFLNLNQTAPTPSRAVDYTQDLSSAKALITIGLYKFAAEKGKLPKALKELSPEFVPLGVETAFTFFYYKKQSDDIYELELRPSTQDQGR